jgi:hypothetical protein
VSINRPERGGGSGKGERESPNKRTNSLARLLACACVRALLDRKAADRQAGGQLTSGRHGSSLRLASPQRLDSIDCFQLAMDRRSVSTDDGRIIQLQFNTVQYSSIQFTRPARDALVNCCSNRRGEKEGRKHAPSLSTLGGAAAGPEEVSSFSMGGTPPSGASVREQCVRGRESAEQRRTSNLQGHFTGQKGGEPFVALNSEPTEVRTKSRSRRNSLLMEYELAGFHPRSRGGKKNKHFSLLFDFRTLHGRREEP